MKKIYLILLLISAVIPSMAQQKDHVIKNLKITILSTMVTQNQGIGEWGFSALVEADSLRILFDTGARERTVLENSRELNVNLSTVPTLVLSHNHADHTTGWLPIRNAMSSVNKNALSVTHVAQGIFDSRIPSNSVENRVRQRDSALYAKTEGKIIMHSDFKEIFPGVYLTGVVPRVYPEKNYNPASKKRDHAGNLVEDIIPEDMSLVIRTEKGLVLLSGCGHSGIINTITHVRKNLQEQPILAAIGGFHLYANSDETMKWTADQLKQSGVRYFMGAHCTGTEAVHQIREWANLKRGECIIGSVGAQFDPSKGFISGPLTN